MQTTLSRADQLFGEAIRQLRREALQEGDTSIVGSAVRSALESVSRAYLRGESRISLSYGVDRAENRTTARMDAINRRLSELFGSSNVSVGPDSSYHSGIMIRITF